MRLTEPVNHSLIQQLEISETKQIFLLHTLYNVIQNKSADDRLTAFTQSHHIFGKKLEYLKQI